IEAAKRALESGPEAVGEVARRVGYGDVVAVRRLFVRTTGLTPVGYRARYGARSAPAWGARGGGGGARAGADGGGPRRAGPRACVLRCAHMTALTSWPRPHHERTAAEALIFFAVFGRMPPPAELRAGLQERRQSYDAATGMVCQALDAAAMKSLRNEPGFV